MFMTYDWLLVDTKRDIKFKEEILGALKREEITEVTYKKMYRLTFNPLEQFVTVRPFSKDSKFCHKIIPQKIRYAAVIDVLNGHWDSLNGNNVIDI